VKEAAIDKEVARVAAFGNKFLEFPEDKKEWFATRSKAQVTDESSRPPQPDATPTIHHQQTQKTQLLLIFL
jgi:hypothetical protein